MTGHTALGRAMSDAPVTKSGIILAILNKGPFYMLGIIPL
jgi:hypothetical protein